ncbi:dihydrofolate reductase family protein [Cohnella lubricantis]|uniref:Dihydrofolate reductase family protein n=1 Tax=Cohnella lubricantis TaxID=2163172 RepID=A0A841TB44_9BACL|nr:dihydrofolate reductase family protein [Cohnella lubricantis]MBB6678693.1 dihydrofolate reductase family protein [Cohnella lubricantis]MBP2118557.1 dihydrofolate reductase [Cohnella lubricantis]
MRKITLFIHSTLNGVVTGDPSEDKTNWSVWRNSAGIEEGSQYLLQLFETADTILLGRGTYEDLSRKWPNTRGSSLGDKINKAHKLVVTSASPHEDLKWGEFEAPKQLTGNNIEEQIKDLKKGDGGDMVIFGSPTLVRSLANANLIDEYQIVMHPVAVNVGEHLFDNLEERKDFHLVDVKPLKVSSLLATYRHAEA